MKMGIRKISVIDDIMISNILFVILHHAVIDTGDNSIIGLFHIQFSETDDRGVYDDIFGYMRGIPYIFASVNILHIFE